VAREISQRELRNESGDIMRALDAGESFVVTRNGIPVGELGPVKRRRLAPRDVVHEAFSRVPPLDAERFRADVDRFLDQEPMPRG
jgi:antitoxin (DNA-binding transcriptional repressor) of toxin-antitoxin stability system